MFLENLSNRIYHLSPDSHLVRVEVSCPFGRFDLELDFSFVFLDFFLLILFILLGDLLEKTDAVLVFEKKFDLFFCQWLIGYFGFVLWLLLLIGFLWLLLVVTLEVKVVFVTEE